MKRLILNIHDYLSSHKSLAAFILIAIMLVCGFFASRMNYQEDISAFLPMDEESKQYSDIYGRLGGNEKVAIFFRMKDLPTNNATLKGTSNGASNVSSNSTSNDLTNGSSNSASNDLSKGEEAPVDTVGTLIDAVDNFQQKWLEIDSTGLITSFQSSASSEEVFKVFDFISANYPYFLKESDYERMDSILSVEGGIRAKLEEDMQAQYSMTSGLTSEYLMSDPLGLFSPVLTRLRDLNPSLSYRIEDGVLFTNDGKAAALFFDSPFGESESGRNSEIVSILEKVRGAVLEQMPQIEIIATGGPLVAVGNASQIKKDSILAISLAICLICLILFFSFRRFADVFWIAISIIWGSIFSIGVLSLFKPSISIIVLGIGSMIIGIAVNYPLHYVDHLKYQPNKRNALKDQIIPLLVGNITTVGAFLSLLLLKADALHDFGLIGGLMLVGTILFVIIFLPVFVPEAKKERNTLKLDFDRHIRAGKPLRTGFFLCFLVLTLVFTYFGRKILFDSDIHNINYMTPEQSEGFDLLSSIGANQPGLTSIYAVSQSANPDEALEKNNALLRSISEGHPEIKKITTIADFLPSSSVQTERLSQWKSFIEKHHNLLSDLSLQSQAVGFSDDAFSPFSDLLNKDWSVESLDYFAPLTSSIGKSMFLRDSLKTSVVNYVQVPTAEASKLTENLNATSSEGTFFFTSSDVVNRLVSLLSEDFDSIGILCSLIVFLFLWLSFSSLELSLVSFLPLAVGWAWILGIMHLTGLQFNIVNIVLATFIFGQGDDYTIFITEGLMYEYACGKKILRSYKNCVVLSALIMFVGIGTLIFAKHPAMKSLGQVTVVGMFTVVAMAYYLPPLVFKALTLKKGKKRVAPVTFGRLLRTILMSFIFIVAMLLFTPAAFLYFLIVPASESRRTRYHKAISWVAGKTIRSVPGARYTLANPFGEDFSKPAIFICNHQSHLDVLAMLSLTPKLIILTNDWVWHSPFYGYLIHKADFFPVSTGYDKYLPKLKELVAKGYSVGLYPEETRSVDCHIQRFHKGALKLAKDLELDILPLYIHGFGYALPKNEFMLRKAGLYLEIGQRIPVASISDDLLASTRELRHHYTNEYERIRDERETACYNAPFVKYAYLYKGSDSAAECKRFLKGKSLEEVDSLTGLRTIRVMNSGCGVYAQLLAKTHRNTQVYAYEADEDKHLTAETCVDIPSNLHFIRLSDGVELIEAEKEIVL